MQKEKIQLKQVIKKYFQNKSTVHDLYAFAWEKIDYFSKKINLPSYDENIEGEFWYAIWQIQHLADSQHE